MMKLKKQRAALAVALVLVVAAVAGVTYAWFTSTASTEPAGINLGDLEIAGNYYLDLEEFFEPGDTIEADGYVRNNGTLNFIAKMSADCEVKIRDEDGDLVPYTGDLSDKVLIGFDMDAALLNPMQTDPDAPVWAWLYDTSSPADNRQYYLVMEAGSEDVDVGISIELVGRTMGNEFKNAQVNVTGIFDATQCKLGAVQDEWTFTGELDYAYKLVADYPVGQIHPRLTEVCKDLIPEIS